MSNYHLILNRSAGASQRGLRMEDVRDSVEKIFSAAGHQISTTIAEPKRLEDVFAAVLKRSPDAIIIGGGDGSVSTAARLMGGSDIALGILPMGTFNLAARDLGVPLELEAAANYLATAETHAIDVLDVSGNACLCTTILGFYPEYSAIFEKRDHDGQWWKKTLKLLTSLKATFTQARPLSLEWQSDGGNGKARTKFSAFVPGRYKEQAGLIPVRTDFKLGHLTAYVGTHQKPASALLAMIDYTLGRQEKNENLELIKAKQMIIRAANRRSCRIMLDGEILELDFPIELKILPGHLNVLTTAAAIANEPEVSK